MPGILALDIATRTGWAVCPLDARPAPTALENAAGGETGRLVSGCENFSRLRDGDYYGRLYAGYEDWLADMIAVHSPDYIVFEAAIPFHKSQQAARMLLGMIALTEAVAFRKRMDRRHCFEVNVQHVKKRAVGKGNAKKAEMMQAARDRGWRFSDDNEADALWLADYTLAALQRKAA